MNKFKDFTVKEPFFKNAEYNIKDFGAVADGKTDVSQSINNAINTCSEKGGGKVVVPQGIWFSGPIELKSNVNLHLESGSVILFSDNYKDYPLIYTSFEGFFMYRCVSPLYGKDLENVAVTGKGVIDGNGDAWRPVKDWKLTERAWKKLTAKGGYVEQSGDTKIWWPFEINAQADAHFKKEPSAYKDKEICQKYHPFLRPALFNLTKCKNVLIEGVTIQNSPAWALHPWLCEDITIRNISIRNPWYSQNGDGLDLDSCKNALIVGSSFDVGDDAICMKSGKNEDGRELGVPTENVKISDCTVFHGHGGFVVGSEMSGGIKNVYVKNCLFIGTDVGLRFKSCLGRGGVVEDIFIEDINMTNIPGEAIIFTMGYDMDTKEGQEVSLEEVPEFKNIYISDVVCTSAGKPITISGLPQIPVHHVYMSNIDIVSEGDIKESYAENIVKENINIVRK